MVCACVFNEEFFKESDGLRFEHLNGQCASPAPDSTAGPEKWEQEFPIAAGKRQSPIDICTDIVTPDPKLGRRPLKWHYPKEGSTLVNCGYGWRVDVDGEGSILKGGPLMDEEYQLAQFHCHWGPDCSKGSEHTIEGQSFPAELHLVHWNKKYGSITEALNHGDGLAVLGIFLEVGRKHLEIQKLVDALPEVQYKDESTILERPVNPNKLLPSQPGYWTYPGSLTTPPCSECVTWLVLREPIEVSEKQLEAFRNMCISTKDEETQKLPENFRPAQPLHNRCVRSSYV